MYIYIVSLSHRPTVVLPAALDVLHHWHASTGHMPVMQYIWCYRKYVDLGDSDTKILYTHT